MKIREIIKEGVDTAPLLTVLQYMRSRSHDQDQVGELSTDAIINMVRNTGVPFDFQALVDANENDDAVKELVKSFNRKTITLSAFGDETEVNNDEANVNNDGDGKEVSRMAKRALNKRT